MRLSSATMHRRRWWRRWRHCCSLRCRWQTNRHLRPHQHQQCRCPALWECPRVEEAPSQARGEPPCGRQIIPTTSSPLPLAPHLHPVLDLQLRQVVPSLLSSSSSLLSSLSLSEARARKPASGHPASLLRDRLTKEAERGHYCAFCLLLPCKCRGAHGSSVWGEQRKDHKEPSLVAILSSLLLFLPSSDPPSSSSTASLPMLPRYPPLLVLRLILPPRSSALSLLLLTQQRNQRRRFISPLLLPAT